MTAKLNKKNHKTPPWGAQSETDLYHGGVLDRVCVGDDPPSVDHKPRACRLFLLEPLPGHRPAREVVRAVYLSGAGAPTAPVRSNGRGKGGEGGKAERREGWRA